MSVDDILDQRGKTYGSYKDRTDISHAVRLALNNGSSADKLEPYMEDAITMIAVKLSRIVSGDPTHVDNWDDIAGYATLAADELKLELEKKQLEKENIDGTEEL